MRKHTKRCPPVVESVLRLSLLNARRRLLRRLPNALVVLTVFSAFGLSIKAINLRGREVVAKVVAKSRVTSLLRRPDPVKILHQKLKRLLYVKRSRRQLKIAVME